MHPHFKLFPNQHYCPQTHGYHRPFANYKKYLSPSIKYSRDCLEIALKDGSRSIAYEYWHGIQPKGFTHETERYRCFGGKAIQTWAAKAKIPKYQHLYNDVQQHDLNNCDIIRSHFDKEFGVKCSKSCQKMKKYRRNSRYKTILFKLNYFTEFEYIEIKVEINNKLVYDRTHYVFHLSHAKLGHIYVSSLFASIYDEYLPSEMDPEFVKLLREVQNRHDYKKRKLQYKGLEYTDCITSSENAHKQFCEVYITPFASVPWGSGHMLTFNFLMRKLTIYEDQTSVKVYGNYKNKHSFFPSSYVQYIELRNTAEPRVSLPKEIGICLHRFKEIEPIIERDSHFVTYFGNEKPYWWKVTEDNKFFRGTETPIKPHTSTNSKDFSTIFTFNHKLIVYEAHTHHSGIYKFVLTSPFGSAMAKTRIMVYQGMNHSVKLLLLLQLFFYRYMYKSVKFGDYFLWI